MKASFCLMMVTFGISAIRVFCCNNYYGIMEKKSDMYPNSPRKKIPGNYLPSRIILNRNYDAKVPHQISV